MKSFKDIIAWRTFTRKYKKNQDRGVIKKFDDQFYAQFEGMYLGGMPIYYYLNPFYANGRCFDASAVLGRAMGDCLICRGDLKSQAESWGRGKTEHGWVEKDGVAFDTTWGIYCPVDVYYRIFKPVNVRKHKSKQFFKDCKDLTDWTIRDKKWYEENYSVAKFVIWGARAIGEEVLRSSSGSPEERKFWAKLLSDLPDETKAPMPELDPQKFFEEKE